MRSSGSLSPSSVSVVRVVLRYAFTSRPGQPETARDRSSRPVSSGGSGTVLSVRRPVRSCCRSTRSSASTLFRTSSCICRACRNSRVVVLPTLSAPSTRRSVKLRSM